MSIKIEVEIGKCSKKEILNVAKFLFALTGNSLDLKGSQPTTVTEPGMSDMTPKMSKAVPIMSVPEGEMSEVELPTDDTAPHKFAPIKPNAETIAPTVQSAPPPPAKTVFAKSQDTTDHVKTNPATTPVPGVELDERGIPWDSRIHARTKTKIANGTWKRKRGVTDVEYEKVVAELVQTMALPSPKTPEMSPVPASKSATYEDLMAFATAAISREEINHHEIASICQNYGIASLPLCGTRPDMIPSILEDVKNMIENRKQAA